jgi:hypothetical protein
MIQSRQNSFHPTVPSEESSDVDPIHCIGFSNLESGQAQKTAMTQSVNCESSDAAMRTPPSSEHSRDASCRLQMNESKDR